MHSSSVIIHVTDEYLMVERILAYLQPEWMYDATITSYSQS